MGRTRINPIKEPRDDLNRQGRRVGDGNKKIKYNLIQRCQESGDIIQNNEFATLKQIGDHLNISRDSVAYMMRKNPTFNSHHNKHLKFIEIQKV
tara:strand:+ start:4858 stop:5139 length:282 start_codon:yes stop_codon:yes gene_type:complete